MQVVKVTKTDDQKEKDGVWTDYGEAKFLIARFPTDEATRRLNQLRKRKRNRDIDVTSKEAREAIIDLISERVLLDWNGVKGMEDGGKIVELKHTKDHCRNLLKIDLDLLDFVTDYSRDIDNYLLEDQDQTVGE